MGQGPSPSRDKDPGRSPGSPRARATRNAFTHLDISVPRLRKEPEGEARDVRKKAQVSGLRRTRDRSGSRCHHFSPGPRKQCSSLTWSLGLQYQEGEYQLAFRRRLGMGLLPMSHTQMLLTMHGLFRRLGLVERPEPG